MDHYYLSFKCENIEDDSKGYEINRKLSKLVRGAHRINRTSQNFGLSGFSQGVAGGFENSYEFPNEGVVRIWEGLFLKAYGTAVYLEGFAKDNQRYKNLKGELEKLGFELKSLEEEISIDDLVELLKK